MEYLDPPSTLKWGLCSFYLGILRVYRGYLGGLGRVEGLGFRDLRYRNLRFRVQGLVLELEILSIWGEGGGWAPRATLVLTSRPEPLTRA